MLRVVSIVRPPRPPASWNVGPARPPRTVWASITARLRVAPSSPHYERIVSSAPASGLDARRRRQRLRKGVKRGAPWAAGRVIVPTREAPWASTGAGSGHAPTCGRAGLATQTQGQLSVTPWISPGTIARTQVIPASPTQCSGRRRPRRERRAGPQSPEQARSRVSRATPREGRRSDRRTAPSDRRRGSRQHHPDGELEPVLGHGCQGPVDEDRDAENERADAPNDAPPANRTGA